MKNDTLILTGWGWKEYAVSAAVALKALSKRAEVMGMSKRRLPEFIEGEAAKWRTIIIVGISLGGDEARLAAALKANREVKVEWISTLPMSESQQAALGSLMKVHCSDDGFHSGELVKLVGKVFGVEVADFLPYALENNQIPKSVPRYHELIEAAMYAYRNYRDTESYAMAIGYLANGVGESAWSGKAKQLVEHYRRYGNRELIGDSEQIVTLRERINFVAENPDARVLVIGESGTGKETVALQIHNRSPRRHEPFVAFNCASVNPELLASRFFGHEKGAYTSADTREVGLFDLANGGTLFLDEIGEMPLEAQGLLLRVLEEGRFMRVGGRTEIEVDVRLITATNRNLPVRVREGKFRADLFMRLNVAQLRIPPLREHKEDIRKIADYWWFTRYHKHLGENQIEALMGYDYPGNVRELLNLLERAVVFRQDDFAALIVEHRQMNEGLADNLPEVAALPDELDAAMREHIRRVYAKHGGNITKAAEALKITRNTLRKYL